MQASFFPSSARFFSKLFCPFLRSRSAKSALLSGLATVLFACTAMATIPNFVQGNYAVPQTAQSQVTATYSAAETAGECAFAHRLANAVHHEPRRFVADADHAVQLVRAHPFLAGAEQESGQKPFI